MSHSFAIPPIILTDDRLQRREIIANHLYDCKCPHWVFYQQTPVGSVTETINTGHRGIVELCRGSSLPYVWILEDDAYFPAGAEGVQYFLQHIPEDFVTSTPAKPIYSACNLLPEPAFAGFHCYIVHQSYYDIFLNTPPSQHIDVANATAVCVPPLFPALQRPGMSLNEHCCVDHCKRIPASRIFWGSNIEARTKHITKQHSII